MTTINLLPWREEYRQTKKAEFLQIAVAVLILALLATFVWDRVMSARIDSQQQRNDLLQQEITQLEKQVQEIAELKKRKQEMLDRMEVIQSLQSNRPDIVRIFDEMVRALPDGVYFSSLTRRDDTIALVGYAESNNRVSSLMRNLDASPKFTDPNLTRVEANPMLGEQGNQFEMRVNLTAPQTLAAETAGDGEVSAATTEGS